MEMPKPCFQRNREENSLRVKIAICIKCPRAGDKTAGGSNGAQGPGDCEHGTIGTEDDFGESLSRVNPDHSNIKNSQDHVPMRNLQQYLV